MIGNKTEGKVNLTEKKKNRREQKKNKKNKNESMIPRQTMKENIQPKCIPLARINESI